MHPLSIARADAAGLAWAQQTVMDRHYRHAPVDVRGRPLAYLVMRGSERVGVLMVSRPESTCTRPLWGSLDDLAAGRVSYSYWSIINLSRVWLDPRIQQGGAWYVHNAATWASGQVRRCVVLDYLLAFPPVDCSNPSTLDAMIGYCQTEAHQGTIYRAAGFTLARTNKEGLETYIYPLRRLQRHEDRAVRLASAVDGRVSRLRARRAQLALPLGEGVAV